MKTAGGLRPRRYCEMERIAVTYKLRAPSGSSHPRNSSPNFTSLLGEMFEHGALDQVRNRCLHHLLHSSVAERNCTG